MTNNLSSQLDQKAIVAHFNRFSKNYDQYAILQREVAERLIDRLELVNIQPTTVVDIGSRTGYSTELLQKKYPQAQVIAIDWAENLLRLQKEPFLKICSFPDKLPLPEAIADLVVVNLSWHWLNNPQMGLKEWRRLLKPGGLLLLSTCGPDTLSELRASFAEVDDSPHVHLFLDMHDIGDALMNADFIDPVMQAERLCLLYSSVSKIVRDLRNTGTANALKARRQSLTGKNRWRTMLAAYEKFITEEKDYPMTVEIVYGLAWAAELQNESNGEVSIPISQIRRNYG